MIESSQELAENKLILLYVFSVVKTPLNDQQIDSIILENNLINYFLLKQYISELVDTNLLRLSQTGNINFYTITKKGNDTLELFVKRIPENIKQIIDDYIDKTFLKTKNKTEVMSDYIPKSQNEFVVNCKLFENSTLLFELNINLATKQQAKEFCATWEKDYQNIYSKVINLFNNEEK